MNINIISTQEYCELVEETRQLISQGRRTLESADYPRLWANLNDVGLFSACDQHEIAPIYKTKDNVRYVALFITSPDTEQWDRSLLPERSLREWIIDGCKNDYMLLINPGFDKNGGDSVLIAPDTGHMSFVSTKYDFKKKTYLLY